MINTFSIRVLLTLIFVPNDMMNTPPAIKTMGTWILCRKYMIVFL